MPITPMPKVPAKKSTIPMLPLHIKLSEEMHTLLNQVAKQHDFPRIQGLIRYYIRRGLDAENVGYRLKDDTAFINKLKRQGVSDAIIATALAESLPLPHIDK